MKNMLFIVGIGVLIIGMPLATALSTPTMTYSKPVIKNLEKEISTNTNTDHSATTDEPPS